MRESSLESLEDKIRITAESSRFRVKEFFIDFDRLRSGFVTKTQFIRVLDQMLKGSVTADQLEALADKYDTKGNATVNYRLFLGYVNQAFPEKDLSGDPSDYVYKNPELLGTLRTLKKLSPDEEQEVRCLLNHINNYYSKRNIDVLTNFRDFDRNNIGTVTESQFRRTLADLPVSQEQVDLLVRKYHMPDTKNLINYLNFYQEFKTSIENQPGLSIQFPAGHNYAFNKKEEILSIQEIVDKISIACFKQGIRITDFFKDYDKLRSGVITDRQFSTALTDSVKKPANLCMDDINQLVEYYRQVDGKCDYKTFCDTIENGFNVPEMEKKPLTNVVRPPNGLLSKNLNGNLLPDEEDQLARVLDEISEKVRKYNIQVYPFFKDYDRSKAFTRSVSKIQFGRVLATLNIMPSVKDYALLCRKFEDPVTGDVNYPAFCQVIDENFTHSQIDDVKFQESERKKKELESNKPNSSAYPIDISTVDLNELMARIRSNVLSNRIRIKDFFQDMDPLNSGYVNKSQFIRCLSSFGISSIGQFNISKVQTEALCNHYKSKTDPTKVHWKKFEEDVESVFTLKNLEKDPNILVPPTDMFVMPPPGTVSWDDEKLNSSEYNYKEAVEYVKNIVNQRRVNCWPPFRDFDKLNRGHVTRKQFLQCLAILNVYVDENRITALEGKFMNNLGFNYAAFLNLVQPCEVDEPKYHEFKKELERLNSTKQGVYEPNPNNDIQSILIKIKDQVFKKRVSIYEWLRDHDKLNSGRIPRETFIRALNLCNFELLPSEIEMIMNYYRSRKDDQAVEYKDFWYEVENVFGKERLEKNPLMESEQHRPKDVIGKNRLLPDEGDIAHSALAKLAERVRVHRLQLFPKFEDFDRVRNGHLSQNQFRRALNDLNLMQILSDAELNAIMKLYFVRVGTRDDVNYTSFCDKLYELGSFEYRKP